MFTTVAAVAMMLPGTAAAATRTVCAGGCMHTTLADAVAAAGASDTIQLAAGTYAERVMITVPLTIVGAQAGVDARDRTGAETILAPSGAGPILTVDAAVTLDGVDLDASQVTGDGAIEATASTTIRNSRVRGSSVAGLDLVGMVGNEPVTIDRSSFDGNAVGIYVEDTGAVSITNSRITQGVAAVAVDVADGVESVTVAGNRIAGMADADSTGLQFSGAPTGAVVVSGNELLQLAPAVRFTPDFTTSVRPQLAGNRMPRRTAASAVLRNESAELLTATSNWWGCAGSPATCGVLEKLGLGATKSIDVTPYYGVDLAVAPTKPAVGTPATVTATWKSLSGAASAALPDGAPVTFTADRGALAASAGVLIAGTSSVAYTAPAEGGKVTITATVDGVATSEAPTTVGAAITPNGGATIKGTPRIGETLTCIAPTWSVAGVKVTYDWSRGPTKITTGPTYVVALGDLGAQLSCAATASITDRPDGYATSAGVKALPRVSVLKLTLLSGKKVLACGKTAKKACALKQAAKLGLRSTMTPTRGTKVKLKLVVEGKVGKRWKLRASSLLVADSAPVVRTGKQLKAGTLRVRLVWVGAKGDTAAVSPWSYVTVAP